MTIHFGDILKEWRGIRRLSQLDLSLEADTSSRHLSFLDSGRARPSRMMILKLADALQMPRAAVNKALLAAGYAPAYPEMPPDHSALEPVHDAINIMLSNHLPLPAVVLDRHWNVVNANASAVQLFTEAGLADATNMIEALIADDPETSVIANWVEVVTLSLARLRTEILHRGSDPTMQKTLARLAGHPRLVGADISDIDLYAPVVPIILELSDVRLSLFSTIAQFGTVQDVAVCDTCVEMMFPTDETTRTWFEARQEG